MGSLIPILVIGINRVAAPLVAPPAVEGKETIGYIDVRRYGTVGAGVADHTVATDVAIGSLPYDTNVKDKR